jgi:hypothetical protein
MQDLQQRLLFLENLFSNEEIVVLAPGPSYNFLSESELHFINDNYIIIAVKYVLKDLLNKNIIPTFFVYNKYLSQNNVEFYSDLSKDVISIISICPGPGDIPDRSNLLKIYLNTSRNHYQNFDLISKNIDCITWKIYETNIYKKNLLGCNALHIMCELAIPLCIHLGVSKIYTCGWDLRKINNIGYFNSNSNNIYKESQNSSNDSTEFYYVPNIKNILNNKNIEIYKIKESPILLDYKNIF